MLDINLDTISSPSSYLFRAVRNASIDYLRSPDNVLHRDMLTNIIDVSVYDEELYEEIEYSIKIKKLFDAIEKLPNKSKLVLKKICFENYSYQQVSDELNISMSTVKTHMYRSYKLLKEYLSDDEMLYALVILFIINSASV